MTTPQQPEPLPASLDLNEVFEEIAALEAQYVPPVQQPEPAVAPAAPQPSLHAVAAGPLHEPLHEPVIPAAPMPGPDTATVPRDPLFDFTPPSPELQEASPFTPPPGATRSRKRYLPWAAGLLSCAVLVLGGGWLYQESKDAGSPALAAGAAKDTPQAGKAVPPPAIAVKEPAPVEDTRARSSEPAAPASRPASSVPPLVYLEPDRPAAAKAEQPASPPAIPAEPPPAPKPAAAAENERVYPLPKRLSQKARERAEPAARPAKPKAEHAPARQLARASVARAERQPVPDTSMEATLKACRAHGYHAAQCVKQGCSVTEYGFVCRGR